MSAKQYLSASGAVSISKISGAAIEPHWIDRKYQRKVVAHAARLVRAGCPPMAALRDAARFYAVALTADQVAIDRATRMAAVLDGYLQNGLMRRFNNEYGRRRRAGLTRLSFPVAKARFRRVLIGRLGNGLASAGLMEEVFGDAK